jgi:glycosyltransferase involved in cell wall biosynthesis
MAGASASDRPQISFVVPCYNEAENIASTVGEIAAAAHDAQISDFEIVIVDDCSTDESVAVVAALSQTNPRLRLIRNTRNLGFGGAYKEGIRNATGLYAIMVPGDNAHPRGSITPILLKAGEADMVIPFVTNPQTRSHRRRVVSYCFTRLLNTLFGLDVPYFNGTVLHKTDLLRTVEIKTNGFAYQAEAVIKLIKRGATYTAVGVSIDESRKQRTTAFKPRNIYRVANSVVTIWRDVTQKA